MRGYSNPGPQQYGSSPQQMHNFGPQMRNNSYGGKGYQGHNPHQMPQAGPGIPSGPQGADEAKWGLPLWAGLNSQQSTSRRFEDVGFLCQRS